MRGRRPGVKGHTPKHGHSWRSHIVEHNAITMQDNARLYKLEYQKGQINELFHEGEIPVGRIEKE